MDTAFFNIMLCPGPAVGYPLKLFHVEVYGVCDENHKELMCGSGRFYAVGGKGSAPCDPWGVRLEDGFVARATTNLRTWSTTGYHKDWRENLDKLLPYILARDSITRT